MTSVVFYEKPGCTNNVRQKKMLANAGHELTVLNLLTEPWTAARLRSFFGDAPVAEWFNRAAPKIKSGEIDPAVLDEETALGLMLAEPILIRRPLIEAADRRASGFDPEHVHAWIGLEPIDARPADVESCRRNPNPSPPEAETEKGTAL
jgi:nitrogenase-associated protein